MRRALICVVLTLGLMIVASAGSRAATVTIEEEHISINMASGWTYERNYSMGGLIYDLYMEGPSDGTLMPPIGILDGMIWPGVVSDDMLYGEMEDELESTGDDPDVSDVTVVSAPENITVDGYEANDCTITMDVSGLDVRSRLVIIGSDGWNRVWKVMFMDENNDWAANSAVISTMIDSISIEEKEKGGLSMAVLAGVAVVVIAIVVVVAVFIMRRKKEPQQVPPPMQVPPPGP
jgi:hypothetical protein